MTAPEVLEEMFKDHTLEHAAPGCVVSHLSHVGDAEHRIMAVIPAHNNESAIGSVVLHALDHVSHVIVADDCSRDHTAKVARLAGATVISTLHESGEPRALLTGLKEAEESGCWGVVILSGDRLHSDDFIEKVTAPIVNEEADLVMSSSSVGEQQDVPHGRGNVDRSGHSSPSPGHVAGSKPRLLALSSRALKHMDFSLRGNSLESVLIASSANNGLIIKEVPMPVPDDVPKGHGEHISMDGPLDKVMPEIGRRRPLLFVGLPGGVCAFAGAILALLVLQGNIPLGNPIAQFVVGAVMFLVGSYFLFSGLALNSMSAIRRAYQ